LLCEPIVQDRIQISEWWRSIRPGTEIRKHSILLGVPDVFPFPVAGAWPGWERVGQDPI